MNFEKISGVVVPMLTPFDEQGRINTAIVPQYVDYLIQSGVSALFPLGTTGEGVLMSTEERCEMAEAITEAVEGRVPVIVHCGAITTAEAIHLSTHAVSIGANAVSLVAPFYYGYGEDPILRHFQAIAEQVPDFPVYLYNFPARTGNPISFAHIQQLKARCPNVVGLKDSSGELEILLQCREVYGDDFNTMLGPDALISKGIQMGIDACVSGNANIVPNLVVQLFNAASRGDSQEADRLQALLDQVRRLADDGRDLSLFKGILNRRALPVGNVRLPQIQAPDTKIDECFIGLQELGVEVTAIA